MLNAADNETLCRVGPGTPMGELMRRYWLPVLISGELPVPDGEPQRVRILGEDLIAFRATSGTVGLIQNACPHRGASMFFGRNEEEGLRCVYHGWKFDVTGACVDMPSEPAESNFRNKVRTRAYPCVERHGVVWTYMGPEATPPPLPMIEPNMLTEDRRVVQKFQRECNWLQAMEGDIDTAHQSFLHTGNLKAEEAEHGSFDYYITKHRVAEYDAIDTEVGTSYAAFRPAESGQIYTRIGHFVFPFYSYIPTGNLGVQVLVRANVPMDDEHTMYWNFQAMGPQRLEGLPNPFGRPMTGRPGGGLGIEYLPNTSDWLGKWRLVANSANDYLIDREAQQSGASYTGIPGVIPQDSAVTESMGAIYNRAREHLGLSDAMIIRTRRRLLRAVLALQDEGTEPPLVHEPEKYLTRSGGILLPEDADWLEATHELRAVPSEYGKPVVRTA